VADLFDISRAVVTLGHMRQAVDAIGTLVVANPPPPAALATAAAALDALDLFGEQIREQLVRQARDEGCTWQEVADALGQSKQWTHQRYKV
jgi:predicted RNA-binding Zn ribbon-like protein